MKRNVIVGLGVEGLFASVMMGAMIGSAALAPAQAKQSVSVPTTYPAGMIIIKQSERQLYFTNGDGTAIRYPVAIGKTGKAWRGQTYIEGKFNSPPIGRRRKSSRATIPNCRSSFPVARRTTRWAQRR